MSRPLTFYKKQISILDTEGKLFDNRMTVNSPNPLLADGQRPKLN